MIRRSCTFDDGPGSKGSAHWKPIKSPTFDQSSLTLAVAFDATGKVGFAARTSKKFHVLLNSTEQYGLPIKKSAIGDFMCTYEATRHQTSLSPYGVSARCMARMRALPETSTSNVSDLYPAGSRKMALLEIVVVNFRALST